MRYERQLSQQCQEGNTGKLGNCQTDTKGTGSQSLALNTDPGHQGGSMGHINQQN